MCAASETSCCAADSEAGSSLSEVGLVATVICFMLIVELTVLPPVRVLRVLLLEPFVLLEEDACASGGDTGGVDAGTTVIASLSREEVVAAGAGAGAGPVPAGTGCVEFVVLAVCKCADHEQPAPIAMLKCRQ